MSAAKFVFWNFTVPWKLKVWKALLYVTLASQNGRAALHWCLLCAGTGLEGLHTLSLVKPLKGGLALVLQIRKLRLSGVRPCQGPRAPELRLLTHAVVAGSLWGLSSYPWYSSPPAALLPLLGLLWDTSAPRWCDSLLFPSHFCSPSTHPSPHLKHW